MKNTNRRLMTDQLALNVTASEDRLFKYFISYALLLLFVVVSVFATSDLQLLQIKQGITLPLINTNTSISGFYLISTIVVCAASIFIAREFFTIEATKKRINQQSSFVFTSLSRSDQRVSLLGVDGALDGMALNVISRAVFFVSGPSVIALLLFRFADYQDRLIFGAQLVLFIVAAYFSYVFYQRTARLHVHHRPILWKIAVGFIAFAIALKVVVCIDVIYLPPQYSPTFFLKLNTNLLNDEDNGTISFIPHIKIDRTENIWKPEGNRQFEELIFQSGARDYNDYFLSRAVSIDLRGRHLRFLDINFQISPRIWAHDADLSGANLSYAILSGSNFVGTNLYAADLTMATLDGSRFFDVKLDHSFWQNTLVRGAFFDTTHFRFASLAGTKFLGSLFVGSNFNESYIYHTDFNAVSFLGTTWMGNYVVLGSKAKVFESRLQADNNIDDYSKYFDANDNDAISRLVGEFCVDKPKASDMAALHILASSYVLLSPSIAANLHSAFEKPGCSAAKSAWPVQMP